MKKWMLIGWLVGILGTVGAQPIPVLDPSKVIDTSFSALFDDVEIIPLETRRESVFGIVKQLLVTDHYFIIFDPDTDAVLFFDKKGSFLTKYKNKQRRYRINFIQLDAAHNALLIFSQNKNYKISADRLQDYMLQDAEKELPGLIKSTRLYLDDLASLRIEELKPYACLLTNPVLLGSNQFAYSIIRSDVTNKDTLSYQLQVMEPHGGVRSFFPYNIKKDAVFGGRNAWQCSFSTTLSDSILLVTRPFDSIVYSLTPSSFTERYKVVTSKQETADLPSGMESVSLFDGGTFVVSAPGFARGNNGTSLGLSRGNIGQVFTIGSFLFFSTKQSFAYDYFIYNTNSQQIYHYKELTPDSSNYMFPLSENILAFDENNIYQSLTARSLFRKRKNAGKSKLQYQESLLRFYTTAKETDNPVLIRIKPKNGQP